MSVDTEKMNVDTKKMCGVTQISIYAIKKAIAIPPEECKASTIEEAMAASTVEEAKAAYYAASDGSEAKVIALNMWIRLTSTIEEAMEVYRTALDGSEAEAAAIRKLSGFFQK